MFGKKYSRIKFWLTSLLVIVISGLFSGVSKGMGAEGLEATISLVGLVILINILANRIRAYGSNPWLALLAIIPLLGLFQALYYGIKEYKQVRQE
ncbi:hypothetical protein FG081_17890 [Vibrio cholerae]|nr:hypothetical protein [Vibrio cholerae]